ncbi:MAG: apolipoprotein N-acyltransferase [Nitriliruptorales bacterium]
MRRLRLTAALGLALAAGLVAWAAHPPVAWGQLSLLVVPLLLAATALLDDGRRGWWGALPGVVAGLAAFLPMISWLIAPAGYLAWSLLAAVQAVWYGLATLLLRPVVRRAWLVVATPVVWTGMEVWRGRVPLSGFSWGDLAYAHADGSWLLPVARVVGATGLTFTLVLLGALVFRAAWVLWTAADRPGWAAGIPAGAALVLALAAALLPPAPPEPTGELDVLAVQGNDFESFAGSGREEDRAIAAAHVELTRRSVEELGQPDLTIWPESSIDRDPFRPSGEDLRPFVEEAVALLEGDLLFGAVLDGPEPSRQFVNSVLLVDDDLTVVDRYEKLRYVPFGEYVPWRSVLEPLFPALQQVPRDGVPGEGHTAVRGADTPVGVVICFETLFPELVRGNVLAGDAGLIVAVTNDASFGRSPESDQHVAQSRLRAVENGRWVIHSAISGGSALIDPYGRVVEETALFERDTIRRRVPTISGRTPYLAAGDIVGGVSRWAFVALVLLFVARWARRRRDGR